MSACGLLNYKRIEHTNLKLTQCALRNESNASADGSLDSLISDGEPPAKTGFQRRFVQAIGHTE